MFKIFDGLSLRETQAKILLMLNKNYSFTNKRVLEIGSDLRLQAAQALLKLGATQVFAVNPAFEAIKSPDERITIIKDYGENTPFEEGYFDMIVGMALLEHVSHPRKLAEECKRLLINKGGVAFLQGSPMWTAYDGHHTWNKIDTTYYKFSDDGRPYEYWEHLCLDGFADAYNCLKNKGLPEAYIFCLLDTLFISDFISRKTPTDIINEFMLVSKDIKFRRGYTNIKKNIFFNKALSKYTEEDLQTRYLDIIIEKS